MYRKTKKLFAVCLTVAMLLTMTAFSTVASAATRYQGSDRYTTALEIVKAGWTASEYAVLATGENPADALSAVPLAKAYNAPILLVEPGQANSTVLTQLTNMGVTKIFIVGGTGAVSQEIETAVATGRTVTRLSGANRYETSVAIANKVTEKLGTTSMVAVANGEDAAFADALSISSIAAAKGMPVLLTEKDSLPTGVSAFLAGKTILKSYVVGGTGVVSDAVKALLPNSERLAGENRYATNVAVMNAFADLKYDKVFLATGENFPDALAGAALAAKTASPVVLVDTTMPTATSAFLNGKVSGDSVVIALGGSAVVAQSIVDDLEAVVNGLTFKVKSITVVSPIEFKVEYTKAVNELTAKNLANYSIDKVALNDASYTGATATLSDDKKVVTIKLVVGDKLTSGSTYYYEVKNVKDSSDVDTIPAYAKTEKFEDKVAPVLGAVSYPDNNTAKVSFSEPMNQITSAAVKVYDANGADVTANNLGLVATVALGGKDLKIDLTGATADKTYTVKVYGATDISGNFAGTVAFNVVKTVADTTKPTVTDIVATGLDTFKITFSEKVAADINGSYGTFYIDVTQYDFDADHLAIDTVTANSDGTVLTVKLNAPLTAALHTIKVDEFKDPSGNTQSTEYVKVVSFKADSAAPKFVSAEVKDDTLYIKFDDTNIKLGATRANVLSGTYVYDSVEYTRTAFGAQALYDPDGDNSTDIIAIPLTGIHNGNYSVKLDADVVEDAANNGNALTSITFAYNSSVDGNKPAVVDDGNPNNGAAGVSAQLAGTPNTIIVTFTKDVTESSACNVYNYLVDGAVVFEKAQFVGDKHNVRLTLRQDAIAVTAVRALTVKNVSDAAGHVMDAVTFIQNFTENVAPTVKSAKVVGIDKIEVKFSENMTVASVTDGDDFELYIGGTKIESPIATVTGTNDTYVLDLAANLTADDLTKDIVVKVLDTADAVDASAIQNALVTGVSITVAK